MTTTGLTPAQQARRKHIAADLSLAGAGIAITTLGARGGEAALRHPKLLGRVVPKAETMANHIHRHTQTALIAGTAIGAAGGINSAMLARNDARKQQDRIRAQRRRQEMAKGLAGAYRGTSSLTALGQSKGKVKAQPGAALPSIKSTTGSTLRMVNAGQAPQVYLGVPGAKTLRRISTATGNDSSVVKGVHSANVVSRAISRLGHTPGDIATGYRIAGRPVGQRETVRGLRAGHKVGAYAHDAREGYRRQIFAVADVNAGKTTHGGNAVYPSAHRVGNLTRRVGLPIAVVGGGYAGGKALGAAIHRRRNNDVTKSEESPMSGYLRPIPPTPVLAKSYGYDPESNRHRRSGVYQGGALLGAAGAASYAAVHGHKLSGQVHVNRGKATQKVVTAAKPGRAKGPAKVVAVKPAVTSVRVSRKGLGHGGRALAGAATAGVLVAAAHRIHERTKQGGSWNSYYD